MVWSRQQSILLALTLVLTGGASRIAAQQEAPPPQQTAPPAQPPSDPAIEDWKPDKLVNVEILPKDMAPDDVIKLMKAFNASLNVDCVFCHKGQVGKPWSTYDFTDTSKKRHETARLMMRTTNELNEKFKDLGDMGEETKVTCATCHRRSRHPEIEPPAGPAKAEPAGMK
jgi:Photosynthetic reaction centre cytochrome C subunit